MRSYPADYELVSPANLSSALNLLHSEPGKWTPIAGGTEIMVLYGAGKLAARNFVSIWGLPELTGITESEDALRIGAGCSYTQLRNHPSVQKHFPLLAQAASWTGSIANQNRGTLAGNIINASPAADSPPALLVYDAELELISAQGTRRVSYTQFHLGYKKTMLEPEELVLAIHLHKRFNAYFSYTRKVGARNAQAISKVCVAALGQLESGRIKDVRIAMGSVAPVPMRLTQAENLLYGQAINNQLIESAKKILKLETAPIDDIRSTAAYRARVAGNLLEEFLRAFAQTESAE